MGDLRDSNEQRNLHRPVDVVTETNGTPDSVS